MAQAPSAQPPSASAPPAPASPAPADAGHPAHPSAWKRAVAQAFDRAADYDGAARIQVQAAQALVAAIGEGSGEESGAAPLAGRPRTLEVGCGTGLLTAALRRRLDLGPMLATDIAPGMVLRCRGRFSGEPGLSFAVMDGERPCFPPFLSSGGAPGFDLIASNLAAQWFEDLPAGLAGLAGLLRPGGLLALTTLAAGTFREWDRACAAAGVPSGHPDYPEPGALAGPPLPGFTRTLRLVDVPEAHADGAAFLRALRAIGAQTPAARAAALSPGALRRALRAFEAEGARVTYRVAILLVRREAGGAVTARKPYLRGC